MDAAALARGAACVVGAIALWLPVQVSGSAPLQTPLEESGYARITSAAEVSSFLKAVEKREPRARRATIGVSASGKPLDALFVSAALQALAGGSAPGELLRVMVVGSLHGNEPAGGEAILMLARDLVNASPRGLLGLMEFILVPVGNPDGRETGERVKAGTINVSALTSPENRALVDILVRWQPDVFIDLHEATSYKPETLARQGYLTDFEAQIEIANNPNIDAAIRAVSRERVRPAIISRLQQDGLRASVYVGEIRDVGQSIAHGSLTLRNLRNRAGMDGAFSLLVETLLDPPGELYPTPHNIRARTARQFLSLRTVILVCLAQHREIAARSRTARRAWRNPEAGERVFLVANYAPDPDRKTISIPLRRIADGQVEKRTFPYSGKMAPSRALELPSAYAITAHQDAIRAVLERQHIRYQVLREPRECRATVQDISMREHAGVQPRRTSASVNIEDRDALVRLAPGTLWVPLRQPARRLIPLLLEPGSNSSLYEHGDYANLVEPGKEFFVLRIPGECGAARR